MKNLTFAILIILTFGIMTSCRMVQLNPSQPPPGQLTDEFMRQPSELIVPFTVNLETLSNLINEKLPSGEIASGGGSSGNTTRYSYSVRRNDPVVLSTEGNELIFQVPILVGANGSYTACVGYWDDGKCCLAPKPWPLKGCIPGLRKTEHGDASPTVYLKLRVGLSIDSLYRVKATTKLDATIGGDTHLHIDLIGNLIRINIDIKDKLNEPLQAFVRSYQKEIDSKVAEIVASVGLKTKLQEYWAQLQRPVRRQFAYVNFQPKDVLFENLKVEGSTMQLAVGLRGIIDLSDKPRVVEPDSLPPLTLINNAQPSFQIYLPVGAHFTILDSIVNKNVARKKIRKGKDWVVIDDVKNQGLKLGEAGAILSEVDFKARAKGVRIKGKLFFTSIPAIDTMKQIAFVQDFKMTPATNSAIINRGVPFLIDNFFYERVKDQLRYGYGDQVTRYMAIANDYVKNIQMGPVTIEGKIEKLNTDGILILRDRLEIVVSANGFFKGSVMLNEDSATIKP